MSESADTTPKDPLSPEELKRALKAFKKRLKLTRLDSESKLGYGPMTKGGGGISAIEPPIQFPPIVWQELAKVGKIKHIRQGLYELVEGA